MHPSSITTGSSGKKQILGSQDDYFNLQMLYEQFSFDYHKVFAGSLFKSHYCQAKEHLPMA